MVDLSLITLAAVLATLIAGGGYFTRSLSASGALAAVVVGTAIFGLGGPIWGLLLVVFFVTSGVLSQWRSGVKKRLVEEFSKGSRRDMGQVLANGGIGALLAVAQAFAPQVDLFPAFVGAIAAVTADTWATEVGLLSNVPPRLITTGEPVPPGTSGGVTVLGSSAAAAAGIVVGLAAGLLVALQGLILFRVPDLTGVRLLMLAPVAGVASTAFDSWLGATVQGIYRCPDCNAETEQPVHRCGAQTEAVRGWRFVNNDAVNLLASITGAAIAWGLDWLLWG